MCHFTSGSKWWKINIEYYDSSSQQTGMKGTGSPELLIAREEHGDRASAVAAG